MEERSVSKNPPLEPEETSDGETRATPDKRVRYQSLRGMRDILPEDTSYYQTVEQSFWGVAARHGFAEIRTPVLEPAELYTRSVGESSDIVHKEMYTFGDRSGNHVALRPEGTAGVTRAYLEHGFSSRPQPVKLSYLQNHYRYERPQAGRYREHRQFGLEIFGSTDPALDAQIILATWQAYQELKLPEIIVQLNSIGDVASKKAIRKTIVDHVRPHQNKLSEDAQRQLGQNPLRILDSKDPAMQELIEGIPPLIDKLTNEDREHFTAVLEYLEQAGVPYELNPRLVRGLDYYTHTVFEFWGTDGGNASLGSGGRYDHLVETLGGPHVPGVGIGVGIDRVVEYLKRQKGSAKAPFGSTPQVFVIQLGDVARKISFALVDQLTQEGISVTSALGKDSISSQLKMANKFGVPLALIIGQKEAMDRSIIIRDMSSGMQDTVPIDEVAAELKRRIPSPVTSSKVADSSK